MSRRIIDMNLSTARRFAKEAKIIDYVPDCLAEASSQGYDYVQLPPNQIGRLKEIELFDYHFSSDEQASAYLYKFDDVDMACAQKYGDKTSWEVDVLDKQAFYDFSKMLFDIKFEEDFQRTHGTQEDISLVTEKSSNSYILFSDGDAGVGVHIKSPKWGSFLHLFRTHDAFYDGEKVEFVRWVNPTKRSWEEDSKSPDVVLKFPDGSEKECFGIAVAFILPEKDSEHTPSIPKAP